MSFGPQKTQGQVGAVLTEVAQKWLDAATASGQLYAIVNGAGGAAWLEASPPGYDSTTATEIMALIGQFNQVAGLLNGTGTLAAAFDFVQAFAVVLDPAAIIGG